eukprot:gnl/TRDRNA2_/TRDRNA2_169148_c0_seq1.p1 gnl/TRDRNA2_/TRDRNA2_169148_c0~~gnl/TRDRNA2_/TRDRNA2_169148_c0_seq1.p1  ORF type:complete len:165 (-),score=17.51 gnl/TRDRNA2_/TRDRNA2_169148_c0_seq1:43-537(-)
MQDVCQITQYLFPTAFMVGGKVNAIKAFHSLAQKAGARQSKWMKREANHSPLMHPVCWVIKSKLRELKHKVKVPWCDVYFNALGDFCLLANGGNDEDALAEVNHALSRCLCESVFSPVRWQKTIETMIDTGVKSFYALGPGEQMKPMMKRFNEEAFKNTYVYTV